MAVSAQAAEQASSAEGPLYQAKRAALVLGADVLGLQQAQEVQGLPHVSIYVGVEGAGTILTTATLSMDGQGSLNHQFDAAGNEALDSGGLFYLGELRGTPGEHKLSGRLSLTKSGDAAEATDVIVDQTILIPDGHSDAIVTVSPGGWLSSAGIGVRQDRCDAVQQPGSKSGLWSRLLGGAADIESCELGTPGDPKVRYAHFYTANKDYLKAAAILVWLHRLQPDQAFSFAYYFELSKTLVGYGLLPEAYQAYTLAVKGGLDPEAEMKLRFSIVQGYLDQEDISGAEATLGKAPVALHKKELIQWQDYKSRLLLARSNYLDAEALLRSTANLADYESYVRYYNLGFSLFTNGSVGQGITVLDRIGSFPSNDPQIGNLSDKANLVLGLHFLRTGQGSTAIPIFERIHSRGRYSNSALLNLGWAWLAPAGTTQSRVMLGDERVVGPPQETIGALRRSITDTNFYQRYHLLPFTKAKLEASEEANYKRALATWSTLLDRDLSEESVQEAYLAIALALDHLGAHRDAISYYERAVGALQASSTALSQADGYIQRSWVPGACGGESDGKTRFERGLAATPSPGVARYLIDTMASYGFQNGVNACIDLTAVANNLSHWEQQVAAAAMSASAETAAGSESDATGNDRTTAVQIQAASLRSRAEQLRTSIDSAKLHQIEDLRQQLAADLEHQQRWNQRVLTDVRFELARLYDGVSISRDEGKSSAN